MKQIKTIINPYMLDLGDPFYKPLTTEKCNKVLTKQRNFITIKAVYNLIKKRVKHGNSK